MREGGHTELREPHLHVFGNIDEKGTRLTDPASRASMTRPSMAELVHELEGKATSNTGLIRPTGARS